MSHSVSLSVRRSDGKIVSASLTITCDGEPHSSPVSVSGNLAGNASDKVADIVGKFSGAKFQELTSSFAGLQASAKAQANAELKKKVGEGTTTTAPGATATVTTPTPPPPPPKTPKKKPEEEKVGPKVVTPGAPPKQKTPPEPKPREVARGAEAPAAESKEKKPKLEIPPSPPVSGDWLNAQLRSAAKGDRRAADSIYQRSVYVQDFLEMPGLSHAYTFYRDPAKPDTFIINMEFGFNEKEAICAVFNRLYQIPGFRAFLSLRALGDKDSAGLEAFMSDPSNKLKTLDAADAKKQGNLLGESVNVMRAFLYNTTLNSKTFESELDKVGYSETVYTRMSSGTRSGVVYPGLTSYTTSHGSFMEAMYATPQLISATALYLSRFDSEGKPRSGIAAWKPPAVIPREPPKDILPPSALPGSQPLPLPNLALPVQAKAPELRPDVVDGALKRPYILWVGTSISGHANEHSAALDDLLFKKMNPNAKEEELPSHHPEKSRVKCWFRSGAGVTDVFGILRQRINEGNKNTIVFEAGVNDLQAIVDHYRDGSIKTPDELYKTVDDLVAKVSSAANFALGRGKVFIVLTVCPWGGYQASPELQTIADMVTERYNSQIMKMHNPIHGVFAVDTQAALGATEVPNDLHTNPPAGWSKDHVYTPAKPQYWLKKEFREGNLPEDPRTGYLHPNGPGHTALGRIVGDQVYLRPITASTSQTEKKEEKKEAQPPPRPVQPPQTKQELPVIPL